MTTQIVMMCISALFTGVLGALTMTIKRLVKEINAIKLGTQATLRNSLLQEYDRCVKKGFASIDEADNFENLWMNYHDLGQNGVMDNIRMKFMTLPTSLPEEKGEANE